MTKSHKFKKTEIGLIPEGWEVKEISTVIKINPKRELKKGIIAKKVSMDKLSPFSKKICDFEITEFKSGSKFANGDTLMARITPCLENGKTAYVDILAEEEIAFGSTEFLVLSGREEIITNDFVYYLSISKRFREHAISSMTGTSGRQRVQNDFLSSKKISIPPIPEQKAIAKILSDLDSKIELLQEQNKILEAIGQAIFKHWFIDFEFPCLPENYKPINNDEFSGACKLDEMKSVCTYKSVGGMPIPEKDKYFVYVLLCSDGSFYIGQTQDIYRRWYEHKTGKGAKWTKANEPIKVIHYEEYATRTDAAKREKELKTGFGRKWLKREYEKLLKEDEGSPTLNSWAEKAGSPAPKSQAEKAGSPAPKSKLRQAGKMVDSEMGMIPEGWRIGKIKDISNRESISYKCTKEDIDFQGTTPILDQGVSGLYGYTTRKPDYKASIDNPVIIFTNHTCNFWFINYPFCAIQNIIPIKGKNGYREEYIYFLVKNSISFIEYKGHWPDFKIIDFIIPPKERIEEFVTVSSSLLLKISSNDNERNTLVKIRNLLLPKLMSGQIRVPLENNK